MSRPDTTKPHDCYINANRIQTPYHEPSNDNLIIAAQGPMDISRNNFWLMVAQMNVGVIITPAKNIGTECAEYFPDLSTEE